MGADVFLHSLTFKVRRNPTQCSEAFVHGVYSYLFIYIFLFILLIDVVMSQIRLLITWYRPY